MAGGRPRGAELSRLGEAPLVRTVASSRLASSARSSSSLKARRGGGSWHPFRGAAGAETADAIGTAWPSLLLATGDLEQSRDKNEAVQVPVLATAELAQRPWCGDAGRGDSGGIAGSERTTGTDEGSGEGQLCCLAGPGGGGAGESSTNRPEGFVPA